MAKEILLYGGFYGYSAGEAMRQLDAARNSSEVALRFNGDGGELRYAWAVIGKAKELKGRKLFKNDGEANSMMAFAFCYNDNNEAFDTSTFMFHRASYGDDYEASEYFTAAERQETIDKNAKLRAAMEAKIDTGIFQRITGLTMDALFAMPGRAECTLTAAQALECKLINRVIPITPAIDAQVKALAAHYSPLRMAAETPPTQTPNTMNADKLKLEFPDVYKSIFEAGITAEHDRAGSILAYIEADQKGVLEAFKSGKPLTETQRSEFAIKAASTKAVTAIVAEGAAPVIVAQEKTPAQITAEAEAKKKFEASMDEQYRQLYPNSKRKAIA